VSIRDNVIKVLSKKRIGMTPLEVSQNIPVYDPDSVAKTLKILVKEKLIISIQDKNELLYGIVKSKAKAVHVKSKSHDESAEIVRDVIRMMDSRVKPHLAKVLSVYEASL